VTPRGSRRRLLQVLGLAGTDPGGQEPITPEELARAWAVAWWPAGRANRSSSPWRTSTGRSRSWWRSSPGWSRGSMVVRPSSCAPAARRCWTRRSHGWRGPLRGSSSAWARSQLRSPNVSWRTCSAADRWVRNGPSLVARAEGNPLFAVELARMLQDRPEGANGWTPPFPTRFVRSSGEAGRHPSRPARPGPGRLRRRLLVLAGSAGRDGPPIPRRRRRRPHRAGPAGAGRSIRAFGLRPGIGVRILPLPDPGGGLRPAPEGGPGTPAPCRRHVDPRSQPATGPSSEPRCWPATSPWPRRAPRLRDCQTSPRRPGRRRSSGSCGPANGFAGSGPANRSPCSTGRRSWPLPAPTNGPRRCCGRPGWTVQRAHRRGGDRTPVPGGLGAVPGSGRRTGRGGHADQAGVSCRGHG
jgi:hypothetical protein